MREICRLCAQEGKTIDLTVYEDGRVSCVRFAGVGGEEARKHNAEARRLREADASSARPLTATLFGGSLTLAVERHARSWMVTAANGGGVLHADSFDPVSAAKREAFVGRLPGFDADQRLKIAAELLSLAMRAKATAGVEETEEQKDTIGAVSVELRDGRRAELIAGGFAVFDPADGSAKRSARIEDSDGKVYVPLVSIDEAERIGLYLPTGVDEYGEEALLSAEIESFIHRYVDISDQDRAIAAKYVLLTYRADPLLEIPYLRAVGDSGNGKSRFTQTVGLICRRPIFTVGMTPAVIYRLNDRFRPTLVIDEFNLDARGEDTESILQLLNAGISRTNKVIRCSDRAGFAPEGFDPFGPKILAGLKTTGSAPFESRAYPVRMEQTTRNDIPVQLTRKMLDEASAIRNKATLWGLRTGGEDLSERLLRAEEELKEAGGIRKRYIQVCTPLYALIADAGIKARFIEQLQGRTVEYAAEKQDTSDGNLVDVIHSRLFAETDSGEWAEREYSADLITGEENAPDERLTVPAIVDDLSSKHPAKYPHTVKSVGRKLAGLGLRTGQVQRRASSNYKKRAIVWDADRIVNLFSDYAMPLPRNFNVRNVRRELSPIDTTVKVRTFLESESAGPEEMFAGEVLQTNDLYDCEHCEHYISGGEEGTGALVALDTETEPFDKKRGITPKTARMIGLSLSYDGTNAEYHTDPASWPLFMPEDSARVIFHNAKFDLDVLRRAGLDVPERFEDTMIASRLLDEKGPAGLKDLAKARLGVGDPVTFEEADRMRLLDPDVFADYARNDARYTFALWRQFEPELDRQDLLDVYELEKKLVPVVLAMESAGMRIDTGALHSIDREIRAEQERLKELIFGYAGCRFDTASNDAVATILYDTIGLECVAETDGGRRSVSKDALAHLAHPIADLILELRGIDKLANAFIRTLPKFADAAGRIHPEFRPLGTATGRFSCSAPNVQQIPSRSDLGKVLRRAFIAGPGNRLVVADYSQMELRILANYSKDPLMLRAYDPKAPEDLHTITARKIFGRDEVTKDERSIAKTMNFGISYGITAAGLYKNLACAGIETSVERCEAWIREYFRTYSGVAGFLEKVEKRARERGFVRSLLGRRRRFGGIGTREARQARNFVIQGTAADIAKMVIVALHERLPSGASLISMVHDEILVECPAWIAEEVKAIVEETMQMTPAGFTVPLVAEAKIADNWGEAK